jgi:outer membrane immunogenic protein
MKIKFLAAAALATIGAYSSAIAADLQPPPTVYKAPPPPAPTWTGCYVGGGGGYGMWNQDSSLSVAGVPITAQTTNGGKGWFGQGQGGCDYQFALPFLNVPLVVGAFGDYDGGNLRGVSDFLAGVGTEVQSAAWSAGGRVGAVIAPRVLTYFDGGWTQAHFNSVSYNSPIAGGGPTGLSLAAQTYNGWFIGSGFEYAIDWLPISGLFLKTEYRYSQYSSANVPLTGGIGGIALIGASLNSQKTTQLISTELVWRFNWFGR